MPIGAGNGKEFEGFDITGRGDMGAGAKVNQLCSGFVNGNNFASIFDSFKPFDFVGVFSK